MKRLLIVSLAVLFAAALLPQGLSAGVGIKGGYALSNLSMASADPVPSFSKLNSPVGGVFFSLGFGPLAIQTEALYVRMGAEYIIEGNGLQYRMDYIQVPVFLKLNIIPAGPIRPFIYAGGYGSYLLKANGALLVGGEVTEQQDLIDMFEKYDYGVVGGAGLAFKLPGIAISIEGRYNYGLRNILKDAGEGESFKNNSLMALVGIGF